MVADKKTQVEMDCDEFVKDIRPILEKHFDMKLSDGETLTVVLGAVVERDAEGMKSETFVAGTKGEQAILLCHMLEEAFMEGPFSETIPPMVRGIKALLVRA